MARKRTPGTQGHSPPRGRKAKPGSDAPAHLGARDLDPPFAAFADNFPGCLAWVDRQLRYRFINATYEQWYGRSPAATVGLPVQEVLGAESYQRAEPYLRRALAGERVTYEDPITAASGEVRHGLTTLMPDADPQGKVNGLFVVVTDITERRRAELALRESEERYRSLFENLLEGFAYCRMLYENGKPHDFVYIAVNQAFGTLTGLQSVVGKQVSQVIPGIRESNPELFEIYGRVALTGRPERFETYVASLGIWFSIAVFSPAKEHFVAIFENITDRKRGEQALRESDDRLKRAAAAGNVGLWDWDLRTNEVYYSPEWKHQIGYEDREIPGTIDEFRSRLHPDESERVLKAVQTCLADPKGVYEQEFRIRHKDGSYRLILARGSPLFDDQGKPIRMLGSHVDITERAELEGQLRQAQRMESIGRLAGGIAHDFNNLLTVMLSTADLAMADLREGDPLRTDFLEIRHAVERAVALTRQLLAFSRKQVLQPAVLNLNTVIANMEKMLRRVIGEDVDLAVVPTEDLASVTVDPGQIEQVIMNLAVNARDAMPDGGRLTVATQNIELDDTYAAQHASVRPGPYVMLAMSDTGVGMDEHTRARIFEPFFTTKERGKGTGLGLSTVFGIVEQSGGHIWVYSEVGKGTAFKIYLPSSAEGAPARGPARPAASTRGTETILVVEDEERLRHLIRRTLESAGYTVLAAANGGEALLLLERHEGTVHLMLTDVVMPGLGVRELAARVGALRQEARVLYMSGYTDDTIVRRGVLEQGIHFLPKPFAPDGLTRKVREVLDAEP